VGHGARDDEREPRDEATVLGVDLRAVPPSDVPTLAEAAALVRERLAAPGETPRVAGYRLFWTRGREAFWRDVDAQRDEFAVFGRHTFCDVRLEGDPAVSLRHVLASAALLDDGAVRLRLLDLQTQQPFTLPGDPRPRRSIVVGGPVLVRVGRHFVGGVPIEAEVPLPPGSDPFWQLERPVVREDAVLPRPAPGVRHGSVITVLPEVTHVSEIGASGGSQPVARLTLKSGAATATVELGERELRRGVMLGRYERCVDEGLRAVLGTLVSRVHLLLLLERDGVHGYDLCSTNGTWLPGVRVRHIRLGREPARLWIGGIDGTELLWMA
jgi:hypothetical protein